ERALERRQPLLEPGGVVRDVEDEGSVALERDRHPRPFRVVRVRDRARARDERRDERPNDEPRTARVSPAHRRIIRRMITVMTPLLAAALMVQAPPSPKVDIVSVTGCLREATPSTWTLEAATDPAPSSANAP